MRLFLNGAKWLLDFVAELVRFGIKECFGLAKILLIFVGVGVLLPFLLPLSPFIFIYFMYDRGKKHKEIMSGAKKKKEKGVLNMLKPVNDWAK